VAICQIYTPLSKANPQRPSIRTAPPPPPQRKPKMGIFGVVVVAVVVVVALSLSSFLSKNVRVRVFAPLYATA
jgi:hypothetical protein